MVGGANSFLSTAVKEEADQSGRKNLFCIGGTGWFRH